MEYFIKASAILILFYLFYKLLLQKETFFQLNRFYLLGGLICSALLPLIVIPIYVEIPAASFSNIDITYGTASTTVEKSIDWIQIITYLYIGGIIIFSSKLVISSYSLLKLFLNSSNIKKIDGISYIETTHANSPFSIFNYIVFNPTMFTKDELEQIIVHEKVHIKQQHSIDVITSEIIKIIFWFNPFFWMYKKEIHQNLEYIADSITIKQTETTINYQHLLLKTCFPNYQYSFTNKFYNSLIKKRITMLQKSRSSKINQWKLTLIVPVLVAFVFTFNTKTIAQINETNTNELLNNTEKAQSFSITKDPTYSKVHMMAKDAYGEVEVKGYTSSKSEELTITVTETSKASLDDNIWKTRFKQSDNNKQWLIVIDEKPTDKKFEEVNPNEIKNVKILKGEIAIEKYGKNDVLEITTKTNYTKQKTSNSIVDSTKTKKNNKYAFIGKPAVGYQINNPLLHTPIKTDNLGQSGPFSYQQTTSLYRIASTIKSDSKLKITSINKEFDSLLQKITNKPLLLIDGKESFLNLEDLDINLIQSMSVLKEESATQKYGKKGKYGVVEIITKKNETIKVIGYGNNSQNFNTENQEPKKQQIRIRGISGNNSKKPLIIVDGNTTDKKIEDLNSDDIYSIDVLNSKNAINKYGDKGKDGVVEVTTKKVYSYTVKLDQGVSPINNIVIVQGKDPIYIIDGKESTKKEALKISNDNCISIQAIRGEEAIKKYGKKAEYGALLITTKTK